jgi:hypothetical protein
MSLYLGLTSNNAIIVQNNSIMYGKYVQRNASTRTGISQTIGCVDRASWFESLLI